MRRDERRGGARAAVCLALIAALAGCGGDGGDNSSRRPPANDPDTAGLPQYMRDSVACLREAGIRVRVPAAIKRLAREGKLEQAQPEGAQGNYLFFVEFDREQKLTQAQLGAARKCYEQR